MFKSDAGPQANVRCHQAPTCLFQHQRHKQSASKEKKRKKEKEKKKKEREREFITKHRGQNANEGLLACWQERTVAFRSLPFFIRTWRKQEKIKGCARPILHLRWEQGTRRSHQRDECVFSSSAFFFNSSTLPSKTWKVRNSLKLVQQCLILHTSPAL